MTYFTHTHNVQKGTQNTSVLYSFHVTELRLACLFLHMYGSFVLTWLKKHSLCLLKIQGLCIKLLQYKRRVTLGLRYIAFQDFTSWLHKSFLMYDIDTTLAFIIYSPPFKTSALAFPLAALLTDRELLTPDM